MRVKKHKIKSVIVKFKYLYVFLKKEFKKYIEKGNKKNPKKEKRNAISVLLKLIIMNNNKNKFIKNKRFRENAFCPLPIFKYTK
jgi:hypothetical protein